MDRRRFLTTTAVAGIAGAAVSPLAAPAIAKDRMEWRVGEDLAKDFPGLGTAAELLAELIGKGTDGRLTVKVFGAGEIVPAFEVIDAVGSGTVEMGHGASYYWKGKMAALQFLTTFPFGLTAQEQNAWFEFGGGQQLADELYKQLGCKSFPAGNTGAQMGGWFNKEINSLEDYKGLKMRIPGLGGEVVKAAGGNVVNLPGAEIPPALQSGAIDAAEWVGPYNDLAFGLYKSAKFHYYPGWHEPGSTLDGYVNLAAWEKLPADIKAIVEAAHKAANQAMLSEFVARNGASLRTLTGQHGVILKAFPDPVLAGLSGLSEQVLDGLAAADPQSRKVMDSLLAFRKEAAGWTRLSDQAFTEARALGS